MDVGVTSFPSGVPSGPDMRGSPVLLIPALLFLLAFPVSSGRYNDDFDDGEDIVDFDDNDFAEFEDVVDYPPPEPEAAPPARAAAAAAQPEDDEDEDEATVEQEDGHDGFEDAETEVCISARGRFYQILACVSFVS